MARDKGPWQDGRRAWERLNGWHQDGPRATPGHADDAGQALVALSDIGLVRRLLDQAELVAVKTARSHRTSWAEIATKLGVTRQSAWERWRELDDAGDAAVEPTAETGSELLDRVAEATAREVGRIDQQVAPLGVLVPNVVGRSWDDARELLLRSRLVAVGPDPDGLPLGVLGWPQGVVLRQHPAPGTSLPAQSPVTLWLEGGGGSAGVREPRRPGPSPRGAMQMREEVSDESIA